ncbi:MAG: C40 family peptidase [Bacteroidales bacterium]|nr:C40 family peptidase [Bacteroidales bacterium]
MLIVLILAGGCKPGTDIIILQKELDSIIVKWVPDQREAVGTVKLDIDTDGELVLKGETDIPVLRDNILKFLDDRELVYQGGIDLLPDSTIGEKKWGLTSVSVSNMKAAPSHSSELVSQAIMGTPVRLLKKSGSWILAQTPDRYIGWINSSSITALTDTDFEAWKKTRRFIYLNRFGDVFPGRDSNTLVSDIVTGSVVADSGGKEGIARVALPDGRKGFIARELLADFDLWCSTVSPEPESLVRFARMFTGHPYLWGGTSPYAVDCSGFMKMIYLTGGIILARDASQQYRYGISVDISSSLDSLRPGDLVFFGYVSSEGTERINHVGMYIGDTKVIHASGMVRINSLDSTRSDYSSYLGTRLKGARRIIGAQNGKGTERVALSNWYRSKL